MLWDLINIGLEFLDGLTFINSLCILPILPIILSESVDGNKARPFGIILGFIIAFSVFSFFSRLLILYTGIDLNWFRYVSYALIMFYGVIMLSVYLSQKFNRLMPHDAEALVDNQQHGLFNGMLFGVLIGMIWTPCAYPIFSEIIEQITVKQNSWVGFLTLLVFLVGVAIPVLLIAYFWRVLVNQFSFFKNNTLLLRKILGLIVIVTILSIIYFEKNVNPSSYIQIKKEHAAFNK